MLGFYGAEDEGGNKEKADDEEMDDDYASGK